MGTIVTQIVEAVVVRSEAAHDPASEARRWSSETEADKVRRQAQLRRRVKLARRALLARKMR